MENIENKVPNGENQDTQNSSFFSENVSSSNGLEPTLKFNTTTYNFKAFQLEELGGFYNGLSGKAKEDFGCGEHTFITYMNVYKNTIADENMCEKVNISEDEHQNFVKYGDILFTQSSETMEEVGYSSVWLSSKTPYLNSFCFGFRLNDVSAINPKFMGYYLRSNVMRKAIMKESQGITRINLSSSRLKNVTLRIPSITAQEKIAAFLSLVDARIEKQRQLVESLKKYKRGALSRIFSNFENWEKTEAKDIATIETGCSNTQDNNPNGLYPFYIRSANIARSDKYIFDGEAVLTIGDGQIGKIYHYINGKFDCHQRVYMITKFKKISGRYFYHFFSTFFYNRAIKMSAKNTVDSVRMDMIAKMPIYFPDKAKQKQIVSTLDTIDSFIDKQTKLLEQMTSLKKGFLQQMFI